MPAQKTPIPKAFEEPARPALVRTSHGPVEYATYGEGPAVLALHGAMGGWDQSLLLARTLGGPGFRYVGISRPGYLGTPLAAGRSYEEQADRCAEVLDALGIRQVAVLAVSGGGPCALQFAGRHPERCWGLVMASACSARLDVPMPFAWYVLKLTARIPPLAALMRRQAAKDPEAGIRRSIPDDGLRLRTLQDPEAGPLFMALQGSTAHRLADRLAGTEPDVFQTRRDMALPVSRIKAPTLVVHGSVDSVAPYAQGKALAAALPGAELLTLEGGEHVAIFTHHAEAKARVRGFLAAHVPSAE